MSDESRDSEEWNTLLLQACEQACGQGFDNLLQLAEQGLENFPQDGGILYMTALAALLENKPDVSLRYQKRYEKKFIPRHADYVLRLVAHVQKKQWYQAQKTVETYSLQKVKAWQVFPGHPNLSKWLTGWLKIIEKQKRQAKTEATNKRKQSKKAKVTQTAKVAGDQMAATDKKTSSLTEQEGLLPVPELPVFSSDISIRMDLPEHNTFAIPSDFSDIQQSLSWYRLRDELTHLGLLQGFDELLCLPYLQQVDTYWYQVETVRKVLKQFRGRVLLADEVGLGKTIEAGMVLKEYLLRGMVDRVLILTPASLVGQWQEEMENKFDMMFTTSYDPLLRSDPQAFWGQKRVIASIAVARRKEQFQMVTSQNFDVVVIDEAHHLKNRTTQNWKLVNAIQKRFLILLSATPIQNSLVELFNLLTLLQPGIFKTEKEFRSVYMTPGKPRVPANRERLRDLMREVMIRNTRSLVDVRLPPRHAVTMRLQAEEPERACYSTLNDLIGAAHTSDAKRHRLALHHLLSAAGSSPAAAVGVLARFTEKNKNLDKAWKRVLSQYRKVTIGAKEVALLELLRRNPTEKKMVFVHHSDTLTRLDASLRDQGMEFVRFDGGMSGPQKDINIEAFRNHVPILLCTESGGEGRNIQFCNTMINFDLPWNPMVIEQRIGRIHRIGQEREVFIFNLVVADTVEDHVLTILDEKINMFELVVGEVGAILGEIDDQRDFAEMIFSTWVGTTEQQRTDAFSALGEQMTAAKHRYEDVKTLDEHLFGQEFETG